jgi:hypothetical protein
MKHYSEWFKNFDSIDSEYSLGFIDGINLIGSLCGFDNEQNCKKIIDYFIEKDLFFKLFQNGDHNQKESNDTFKKGQKIQRYLSIFQLLIFSLKEFKGKYWLRCGLSSNLLNDILELTKCLLQLSSRKLDYKPNKYNILFTKFRDSDILNYTSSYDVIAKKNKNENVTPTILELIQYERSRIYELKDIDTDDFIFKNESEKNAYYSILDNIQDFIGNIQNQISNLSENNFNRIKSKTESGREIVEGDIKLISRSLSASSRNNLKTPKKQRTQKNSTIFSKKFKKLFHLNKRTRSRYSK